MNPEEIKRQKQQEGKRRNRMIIITILLLLFVLVIAGGVTPTLFNGFFNKAPLIPVSEVTKPIVPKVNTPKDEEILIPEETQIAAIDEAIAPIITPEPAKTKPKFSPLKTKPPITNPTPSIPNIIPGNITIPNTPEIPLPQPGDDIPDIPEDEGEDPLWPYVTTFVTSGGTPYYDYPYGVTSLADGSTLVTGALSGEYDAVFADGELNETTLTNFTSRDSGWEWDTFLIKYNPNGTLAWAKRSDGTGDSWANAITSLADGSSIITGEFDGEMILGKDEVNEITLVSTGEQDMFIAKYDVDGNLVWAKKAGNPDRAYGSGISSLSDGGSMVVGFFQYTITLGEGESNETILTSINWQDIFIAKYNADGSLAWAKNLGILDGGNLVNYNNYKLETFADDSFVINGIFRGSPTLAIGELNETTLLSEGGNDIAIAKYDTNGNLLWAKSDGGLGNEWNGYQMGVNMDGSILITGEFGSTTAIFGQGEVNETVLNNAGNADIFIAKYNSDGSLAWAKKAGGTQRDYGMGIRKLSDGSMILTGAFRGTATFGQGEANETTITNTQFGGGMFFAKYDINGNLVWIKATEAYPNSYDWLGEALVAIDSNDNITIAGDIGGTRTFGEGDPGETTLSSYHYYEYDIFVAKYNSEGILSDALPTQKPPQPCITPPISNNLILYLDICTNSYPGTGTVWTDLSPSGDNGELIGPFTYKGKYGGSLMTNKDRFVEVSLPSTKNIDTYSYNAWVKTTGQTSNDYAYIVNLGDDLNIFYTDGNELALASPYYNTGFNLEVGKWYNVAVTHTVGEDIKFYVNGELIYTSPDTNSDMFSIDKYQIGGVFDGTYFDGGWNGNISHVSIYDRALTQGELQQFFDATKSRFGNIGLVP